MPIEMVRRIIAETLARFGRDAKYDDYQAVGEELFPEELRALAQGFKRQGFVKWIKAGMRQTANIDESDADAPTVQLDWVPGLAAPAYLNIGSMQEPSLIEFGSATVEDMVRVIAKRVTVTRRITARIEDLSLKLEWLKANRRRDDESIAEVCSRLEKQPALIP